MLDRPSPQILPPSIIALPSMTIPRILDYQSGGDFRSTRFVQAHESKVIHGERIRQLADNRRDTNIYIDAKAARLSWTKSKADWHTEHI